MDNIFSSVYCLSWCCTRRAPFVEKECSWCYGCLDQLNTSSMALKYTTILVYGVYLHLDSSGLHSQLMKNASFTTDDQPVVAYGQFHFQLSRFHVQLFAQNLNCLKHLSTQPSTLCGRVKYVSACGLSNNNKCRWCMWTTAAYRRTHSPSQLAWCEGQWPPGTESAFVKWTGWTLAMAVEMTTAPKSFTLVSLLTWGAVHCLQCNGV